MWKWFRDKQDLFNENEDLKREVSNLKSSCNSLERKVEYINKEKSKEINYIRKGSQTKDCRISHLSNENKKLDSTVQVLLNHIKGLENVSPLTTVLINQNEELRSKRLSEAKYTEILLSLINEKDKEIKQLQEQTGNISYY